MATPRPEARSAGASLHPRLRSLAGDTIGRWTVESLIAIPSGGAEYAGHSVHLGDSVQILAIDPSLDAQHPLTHRFERLVRCRDRLDHPRVQPVIDVDRTGDIKFVVTGPEWGIPLEQVMTRDDADVGDEHLIDLAIALLDALAHMHRRDVVHGDIHPRHVMVDPESYELTMLVGLGYRSVVLGQDGPPPPPVSEPFGYLSPECSAGEPIDHQHDLFSVGLLLYVLASGKTVWSARQDIKHESLALPSDPRLARAIQGLIQVSKTDRFASAELALAAMSVRRPAPKHRPSPEERLPTLISGVLQVGQRATASLSPDEVSPPALEPADDRRTARYPAVAEEPSNAALETMTQPQPPKPSVVVDPSMGAQTNTSMTVRSSTSSRRRLGIFSVAAAALGIGALTIAMSSRLQAPDTASASIAPLGSAHPDRSQTRVQETTPPRHPPQPAQEPSTGQPSAIHTDPTSFGSAMGTAPNITPSDPSAIPGVEVIQPEDVLDPSNDINDALIDTSIEVIQPEDALPPKNDATEESIETSIEVIPPPTVEVIPPPSTKTSPKPRRHRRKPKPAPSPSTTDRTVSSLSSAPHPPRPPATQESSLKAPPPPPAPSPFMPLNDAMETQIDLLSSRQPRNKLPTPPNKSNNASPTPPPAPTP